VSVYNAVKVMTCHNFLNSTISVVMDGNAAAHF